VASLLHGDVSLVREPAPAADSEVVAFLESHALPSGLIISHVRRATCGAVSLPNTQTFVRRLWGAAHVFAHNGFVAIDEPQARWAAPLGETDSERAFGLLLTRLAPLWQAEREPDLAARARVVGAFAAELRERGAANFRYSDGRTLFAHGHRRSAPGHAISDDPGLYLLQRSLAAGDDMARPCEGVRASGECTHQCVVATVPLDEQSWQPLRPGELVCIQAGRRVDATSADSSGPGRGPPGVEHRRPSPTPTLPLSGATPTAQTDVLAWSLPCRTTRSRKSACRACAASPT
jgi:glutamine amidotransferase